MGSVVSVKRGLGSGVAVAGLGTTASATVPVGLTVGASVGRSVLAVVSAGSVRKRGRRFQIN